MDLATLPPIEYAPRADAVRARLIERDLTALAVTDMHNVRWLTGFTGSSGVAVLLPDLLVLVTDGRYADRAAAETEAAGVDADLRIGFTQPQQHELLVAACAGLAAIGADSTKLSYQRWQTLSAELPLVPADGVIEDARRVKDVGEVARIAAACGCADRALADVAPLLAGRPTEADVRDELEYRMRRHGADGPSYDTIVASGPHHAARPHHQVGRRVIDEGDTVVVDVGGLVDGYHSDMTRSFVVGEPSTEQQDLYDLLLQIQRAGLAAVRAGVAARAVDAVCRGMVADAGYAEWFLHSTGHGVGLLIHEDPFETPVSAAELRQGDVVTVEPGLYRVGFGGFRIEDLVEVTDSGCRILTRFPKDTPCLPSQRTT
ncbi:MAG TPA: Xaa-Pro peptidase family protein [Ilumatobacter sp.]|jgi:Xaa-Pro aminopeptidase|nr:Xaa-Pro peptidase family protein [Ilumatobacter sp.]